MVPSEVKVTSWMSETFGNWKILQKKMMKAVRAEEEPQENHHFEEEVAGFGRISGDYQTKTRKAQNFHNFCIV